MTGNFRWRELAAARRPRLAVKGAIVIENILTQLGATTVVVAVAGYLLRSWLSYQIRSLRTHYEHKNSIQIETIRNEFSKDITRLGIHENYLHRRRVELIETIYRQAVDAEFSLQTFFVGWWAATDTEGLAQRELAMPDDLAQPMGTMKKHGRLFCERFTEINSSLHKNALFFDDEFIRQVREAYDPFFQLILHLDYNSLHKLPDQYKDVVSVGRIPRELIVDLFRRSLGVFRDGP